MNWIKPLTIVEFVFIGVFLLVNATYFIRLYLIARRLGTTARSIILKFFIRAIYIGLCILGLLGPSFGINEIEAQSTGKDIFFVFDLSRSMDAIDIEPTRLERVKFEITKNLGLLKSDRLGLIVFAPDAYVHTPLTFDREAIKLFIQKLNTNLFSESGTNLNAAFELISQKFKSTNLTNRKTKVIVLVTDGEDFGELDKNVIFELKKEKVNLLILGVGTQKGGLIKIGNEFKKDKEGKDIVTVLDANYLKKLSSVFGGKYFQLTNQVNEISTALNEVNNLQNNWIDTRKMTVANNKYNYFVILALILMIVDILVTVRTIKI